MHVSDAGVFKILLKKALCIKVRLRIDFVVCKHSDQPSSVIMLDARCNR